jgi:hypothetical protein
MMDYFTDRTIEVGDDFYLNLHGRRLISTADPVFRLNGKRGAITNGRIQATAGRVFEAVSVSRFMIQQVHCYPQSDKAIWHQHGGQAYDLLVQSCEWESKPGASVPMVDVKVQGATFNRNSFKDMRFQTNGNSRPPSAPVVRLENIDKNWVYGNAFEDINFEIPLAGAIHLYSAFGTTLRNVQVYDTHLGTITDHMIKLSKSPTGGLMSAKTSITDYLRPSGTLPDGKYDIWTIPNSHHYGGSLIVDNPGGTQGAKVRVNVEVRGGQWLEV